ncbi:MAG TPA: hypothetical protein ENK58_07985 [Desulfobacterales bacterium]|nr:hypothetical protein [Desulfobacterales bacterium]
MMSEYEEFDLFRLNKEDFELMYLILCRESILNDMPEKLKKESVSHEESVSKELYADYSVFRKRLLFKKELTKCKVKIKDLGLKERKEWQDYFIEQKEEADKLKSVIDSTDREIDQMVYELYGLTQEEIEIVEKCQTTS